MQPQGVVTLCDSNYFPGLLSLHASIQTSRGYPVAVYDIGLTPDQRRSVELIDGLSVLDLPDVPLIGAIQAATRYLAPLKKPGKRIWPLWICPLLIRAAPFEEIFWLDCDVLVLRGLDELFEQLRYGPVFTPENKAPELAANSPELYELLPIARPFDRRVPVVNAGVSGWRRGRDDAALDAYIRPIAAAACDPAVMRAISWHDQGALIWAIQNLGLEHRVLGSPRWNLCVDQVAVTPEIMSWDLDLCRRLRAALPEVCLLHWNGCSPPWSA